MRRTLAGISIAPLVGEIGDADFEDTEAVETLTDGSRLGWGSGSALRAGTGAGAGTGTGAGAGAETGKLTDASVTRSEDVFPFGAFAAAAAANMASRYCGLFEDDVGGAAAGSGTLEGATTGATTGATRGAGAAALGA